MKKYVVPSVIAIASGYGYLSLHILQRQKSQSKAGERRMKTKRKILKNAFIVLLCLAVVGIATLFIVNGHVKSVGKDRILSVEKAAELEDVDCIIVLGCQVKDDGSLSHMLRDRLIRALEVYEAGAAPKLLMSGDHGA